MPTFYFNKLVRDKVLQRCLQDPKVKTTYHRLSDNHYRRELILKLKEEADEIAGASEETLMDEIADLQEVLDALIQSLDLTQADIDAARTKKATKHGGFDDRAYIEKVDLDDDSEWVTILRQQPDKYKELE